jgi:hypothetical protein
MGRLPEPRLKYGARHSPDLGHKFNTCFLLPSPLISTDENLRPVYNHDYIARNDSCPAGKMIGKLLASILLSFAYDGLDAIVES